MKKIVKWILMLLICVMFSGMPTHAKDAHDYTDVYVNSWFYVYVKDVSAKELMTGMDSTTFGVDDKLARAQFATVLYRMAGKPNLTYERKFADVPNGEFFSIPVTWASKMEIVTGYSDTDLFGSEDTINREQLATMLYRYAWSMGCVDTTIRCDYSSYPDADAVNDFASEAMKWAIGIGLITGDQGYLNPQGEVNRAVCATMISRFSDLIDGSYNTLYDSVIQKYVIAAIDDWNANQFIENDMSYLCVYNNTMGKIGYYYEDIDQDGTNELFIGRIKDSDVDDGTEDKDESSDTGDSDPEDSDTEKSGSQYEDVVYDLYTIKNREIIHVAMSKERNQYYLCADNTIVNESSVNTSVLSWNYYNFIHSGLSLRERIVYDEFLDAENPWFYSVRDDVEYDTFYKSISEEEAKRLIGSYFHRSIKYTPLTEF